MSELDRVRLENTGPGLRHIWIEIANGRGQHGGFLRSFAEAFAYADPDNINIITEAASVLVHKYHLEKYLDTFCDPQT